MPGAREARAAFLLMRAFSCYFRWKCLFCVNIPKTKGNTYKGYSRPNVCQNCGKLLCASSHREKISRPTIFKYNCASRNCQRLRRWPISRGTKVFENGGTTYFFLCSSMHKAIFHNFGKRWGDYCPTGWAGQDAAEGRASPARHLPIFSAFLLKLPLATITVHATLDNNT